jgi:diacylglycerol kinase family enzyme
VNGAASGGRIPVFLNTSAGKKQTSAAELQQQMGDAAEVRPIAAELLTDAVRRAAEAGTAIIGVAGGDGSMRAAARALAGSRTALLPVPTGTLNNFAQRVGIRSVSDAVVALERRRIEGLPVGIAGDHLFLNTLTFGEYSRIVRMRETYRRGIGKWPAAALAFAVAMFSVRRLRLSIHLGGEVLTRRTPFVWVGIGWGSFPRVKDALERRRQPDLEVAVLATPTRVAALGFMLRLTARMAAGQRPVRDRALEIVHGRALTVDSSHRIDATADGEVLRLQPPVTIEVQDGALRVVTLPEATS